MISSRNGKTPAATRSPIGTQFKVELAGSMDVFNKLEEAASTMGRYYVHDA
jgi:hypothetical protein